MIWSAALMLDFLGNGAGREREAHDAIVAAIEDVLRTGRIRAISAATRGRRKWVRQSPRGSRADDHARRDRTRRVVTA